MRPHALRAARAGLRPLGRRALVRTGPALAALSRLARRRRPDRHGARRRDRAPAAVALRARAAEGLLRRRHRPEPRDARGGPPERRARRCDAKVRLQQGDARSLPFEDGQFDALTFTYLLRYVEDPRRDAARARARRATGRHDRRARVRRPARASGARSGSSGCASACRPPARVIGDGWHEVGRVPRPVDPRALRALAAAAPARRRGATRDRRRARDAAEPRRRDRDVGTQDEVKSRRSTRCGAGGWRDYVTLLHPPYTLWHLSYVAVGAALAPRFHLDRMLWAMAAFFLAMGVAAHALDELQRPAAADASIPCRCARRARRRERSAARSRSASAPQRRGAGACSSFVAVGAVLVPGVQPRARASTPTGASRSAGARSRR